MTFSKALPAALASVLAGGLLLAGCGTGDGGATTAAESAEPRHNAADVEFATAMIPHHGQAIDMADLALNKAKSAEVRELAEEIQRAQDPEIEKMSEWLRAWGAAVPPVFMDTGGGHDHSEHDHSGSSGDSGDSEESGGAHDGHGDMGGMDHHGDDTNGDDDGHADGHADDSHAADDGHADGMMSAEQMSALEAASGTAFDKQWVELMIEHHEGAVAMSETELDKGKAPRVKRLAQQIIDGQTAEIDAMRELLPKLG